MKIKIAAIFITLCAAISLNTNVFALYPTDVQELADGSGRRIVRVYELSPDENPDEIPTEGFERNGFRFELTEIVRQETELEDRIEHSETVMVESATKELETVLPLLPPTMEYASEDDYSGILTLDSTTLTIAEAASEKQGYTLKTIREYPGLSDADASLVPKTVTERGLTYTLQNVDWQSGNQDNVDYNTLPASHTALERVNYTAVATYSVSGSKTVVTSYAISAEYRGELVKLSPGKVRYTAYFAGVPIADEQDENDESGANRAPFNAMPLLIAIGGAAILGAGGFFAYRKLRGKIRKF
jgi:hypothetical protein